ASGAYRFTEGRLSAPFKWRSLSTMEERPLTADAESRLAALTVQRAASDDSTASGSASIGIALLALGDTERAIAVLEDAVALAPDDVRARIDLSAALLARVKAGGEAFDAVRAVDETGRVLAAAPQCAEATFNQALALEHLGVRAMAIEAWSRYRRL